MFENGAFSQLVDSPQFYDLLMSLEGMRDDLRDEMRELHRAGGRDGDVRGD